MNENENEVVKVEEPDWGLLMFWEDLTALFQFIASLFKALFS